MENGLEIYSEENKDSAEMIIEPPDNLAEPTLGKIHYRLHPNNRFIILCLLAIIAPLFLISLWQRFQLHAIEKTLRYLPGIEISLAKLNNHIKTIETNYQHSMASINEEIKNIGVLSMETESLIDGLGKLSSKQKKNFGRLEENISDIKSKLITLDGLIKEEREHNAAKESDNK